jgi:RNA ligase
MTKPLGGRAYGSIPHLSSSRMGPGDHGCSPGEERWCTVAPQKGDRVVVLEKLDGACVSVANVDGEIVALVRAGHRAETAPYRHLQLFGAWARERAVAFTTALMPGERIVGEWLLQAHGTRYDSHGRSPFVAFDLITSTETRHSGRTQRLARAAYRHVQLRARVIGVPAAHVVSDGPAISTVEAYRRLTASGNGFHGAIDPVEGCVWRIERGSEAVFLAKWVRSDKRDGSYLPEIAGGEPVWNWDPKHVVAHSSRLDPAAVAAADANDP